MINQLEKMSQKPVISVVSASLAQHSRSRCAAEYFAKELEVLGASVDWIDLKEHPVQGYPLSAKDPALQDMIERVQQADGLVLAFPIHNWGESGHVRDFLAYALDKKKMKNRVCILIAGCSTKASFLAPMSLSKTLQGEIGAVVIGPGILASAEEVNKETQSIHPELQNRLTEGAQLLYRFSQAAFA